MIKMNNIITYYVNCSRCVDERPDGMSPADYQDIEMGLDKSQAKLQVWCKRHDAGIAIFELEESLDQGCNCCE